MSRRHSAEKITILPDAKFGDLVLSKFIPSIYFGLLTGLAMLIALLSALLRENSPLPKNKFELD